MKFFFIFSILSCPFFDFVLGISSKNSNLIGYFKNNKLNNNIFPSSIEYIPPKKNFLPNNGTDFRYPLEKNKEQELEQIVLLKQNFNKKKMLEFLQDNNSCIQCKLNLLENYSFLFIKEKGIKKDFDEFLSS